jgi:hypothetical protein
MKITQKIKWIDVTKKHPRVGEPVFCIQDPTKTATKTPLIGVFDGYGFRVPFLNQYNNFEGLPHSKWVDIIYWMPLYPQTPKELSV